MHVALVLDHRVDARQPGLNYMFVPVMHQFVLCKMCLLASMMAVNKLSLQEASRGWIHFVIKKDCTSRTNSLKSFLN